MSAVQHSFVSVVIPVTSPEIDIQALIEGYSQPLRDGGYEYELIFVLDGVRGAVADQLEAETHSHPMKVVRLQGDGLGEAIALSAGVARARGKIIINAPQYLQSEPQDLVKLETTVERIPGSTVSIELVKLPASEGELWMSTTEISWDAYDVYIYGLDEESEVEGDALSRPTKPYITTDRGFGHNGYAVISPSLKGAQGFCEWLSKKTGGSYRLPTEAEWERACLAGGEGDYGFRGGKRKLDEYAWFAGNANHKTHPLGSKRPNAWGLHDMHGNAAEWCLNPDGSSAVRGGAYRDRADAVTASSRQLPTPAWNASDPQIPKSTWWLADAGFVGFRVVRQDSE